MTNAAEFNLLHEAWLPVRRRSDAVCNISPAAVTQGIDDDPIVAFAWPRADFNGASIEFMIGLLSTAAAPEDEDEWQAWWHEPPSAATLAQRFASVAHAFSLDGAAPRFMQDIDPLDEAKTNPAESLLIDAPGEATIKKNSDIFFPRGRVPCLGRAAAAMALFTLNAYAPEGGPGYRTSVRGGGPLTTLIVHDNAARGATLWDRIWCNVESMVRMRSRDPGESLGRAVFPWLSPTRTSEKTGGASTTPSDVHPMQVYWGMPRRMRLVFENGDGRTCALTGVPDDVVVTGYRTKNLGTNYIAESFEHPLTPYSRKAPQEPARPRHPTPRLVGYRLWTGVVVRSDDGLGDPARTIRHWQAERRLMVAETSDAPRLHAFGYDTKAKKVRDWMDSEMPLWSLGTRETSEECESFIRRCIAAAATVGSVLTRAVKEARPARIKVANGDYGYIANRLTMDTENAFQDALGDALRILDGPSESDDPTLPSRQLWLASLRHHALSLFDEYAPSDGIEGGNMQRHVQARHFLTSSLRGHGKTGKQLFERDLGIALPGKGSAQVKGKGARMTNAAPASPPDVAHDWWGRLVSGESGHHRAALARIRRASTPLEVIQEPEALRLVTRLHTFSPDRVAILAGVLAHVRESPATALTRALGEVHSAALSETRFRRLLQAETHELLERMRRLVKLSKGAANVQHLAEGILYWGDSVKQRWIFEYYGVGGPQQEGVATAAAPLR